MLPPQNSITAMIANQRPYFENKLNVVYFSHEGENVTLKCAPKNFNENHHSILWYRDELPITNGNITLVVGNYEVDNKHSLTIYNYTSTTVGNFSCQVLPGEIRQYVKIELKAPENISEMNGGGASLLSGSVATINSIIMMLMAMSMWY
ncbi:uncharacterized protein LOC133325533 [Musca vetustissima]|uniref:uncharacterized protein LOC133325533 n=1 Tax=Musca vetustissima TaxID=27455 RepID=UPI002AB7A6A6|nr:uncharacterized protein LOC133325533 [Musca vetustissima]